MTTEAISPAVLHIRQAVLIAPALAGADVIVAGAGMLGSWTALALARCAHSVTVYDFDTVEDVNAGTQAYSAEHLGLPKVEALGLLAGGLPLRSVNTAFPLDQKPHEILGHRRRGRLVVVSAVDSFRVRREVAAWARLHRADLFVDTRAHGEVAVHMVVPPERLRAYITNLETDEGAPPAACGMEGTAWVGMRVAADVTGHVNAYFKGLPVPYIEVTHTGHGETLRKEML